METIFFPKSVAIIGASKSPSNKARVIVENMERFGFQGIIYLVGGKPDVMDGRQIFTDIRELPETPDLAVILIPASGLIEVLNACGEKGIRQIVIESGGFSEFGEERKALEQEILNVASTRDMKIVGPNCVGIVNVESGICLPFYPLYPHETKKGHVSVISQSGGLIHDIIVLCNIEGIGVNKLVSIGNKLVCDENDFLEYLISDPTTRIIALYLENVRNGRRFMDLASSTGKPIVLLKSNRSGGGSEIARFHTSALAGDDRVVDEGMKQAGVHRVENLREMTDCFKAFSLPPLKGSRLVAIGRSGGHAVLAADSIERHGFTLASLSDEFFGMLSEKTRAGVIRRTNPVDLGDVFDFGVYFEIAEKALAEKDVDGILILHSYALGIDIEPSKKFISSCGELSRRLDKPVIFCAITHKDDLFSLWKSGEIPVFTHVDDALKAFTRSLVHHRNLGRQFVTHLCGRVGESEVSDLTRLPTGIRPVQEVFSLLKDYGLSVADFRLVNGIKEGLEGARDMGYPVALKIADQAVLHKTEEGGVILCLEDEGSLEKAFKYLNADSYLLQKMVPQGCEMIIGGRHDPEFGPIVLCGLGGIFVEVYRDVAIRVAPVNAEGARDMVGELKGATILNGFRGKGPYDVDCLVSALVGVSNLLADHPEIETLDINPIILGARGNGGTVVDAKLRVR